MKSTRVLILIGSLIIFISCEPDKEQLYGTYVSNKSENSVDSLFLQEDHTYRHSIYTDDGETLILNHQSKWSYQDGYLDLHEFYGNDNRKFNKDIDYKFDENYMLTSSPVYLRFGKITIDINSDLANEYVKVISRNEKETVAD